MDFTRREKIPDAHVQAARESRKPAGRQSEHVGLQFEEDFIANYEQKGTELLKQREHLKLVKGKQELGELEYALNLEDKKAGFGFGRKPILIDGKVLSSRVKTRELQKIEYWKL